MIMEATMNDDGYQADTKEIPRIQQALENLRKHTCRVILQIKLIVKSALP